MQAVNKLNKLHYISIWIKNIPALIQKVRSKLIGPIHFQPSLHTLTLNFLFTAIFFTVVQQPDRLWNGYVSEISTCMVITQLCVCVCDTHMCTHYLAMHLCHSVSPFSLPICLF